MERKLRNSSIKKIEQIHEEVTGVPSIEKLKEAVAFKEQNDPARICGNIWFNGTPAQRAAFKGGTKGRGRDEKPPKEWWDDCISKVAK